MGKSIIVLNLAAGGTVTKAAKNIQEVTELGSTRKVVFRNQATPYIVTDTIDTLAESNGLFKVTLLASGTTMLYSSMDFVGHETITGGYKLTLDQVSIDIIEDATIIEGRIECCGNSCPLMVWSGYATPNTGDTTVSVDFVSTLINVGIYKVVWSISQPIAEDIYIFPSHIGNQLDNPIILAAGTTSVERDNYSSVITDKIVLVVVGKGYVREDAVNIWANSGSLDLVAKGMGVISVSNINLNHNQIQIIHPNEIATVIGKFNHPVDILNSAEFLAGYYGNFWVLNWDEDADVTLEIIGTFKRECDPQSFEVYINFDDEEVDIQLQS